MSMKKMILMFVLVICLTACQKADKTLDTSNVQIEELNEEISSLKIELEKVQQENISLNKQLEDILKEQETEEAKIDNEHIIVQFISKEELPEDIYAGRYNDVVLIEVQVTNNSDKNIKGIEGVVDIQDMFGKDIIRMNCDLTGQIIQSNESVIFTDLGMEINPFMDDHVKLYNTKFDDLIFVYTINRIMFEDGTLVKY